MKRVSTLLFKIVILLIAIGTLVGLICFPQTEGRAENLDIISIYKDPLIIYSYIASVPFFIGLFQAFKLLNLIDRNQAFSQSAVNALRNIKFAFLSVIGFIIPALFYIRFVVVGDDPAGPTMLGICMIFAFGVIATVAGVFQKNFQKRSRLKIKK